MLNKNAYHFISQKILEKRIKVEFKPQTHRHRQATNEQLSEIFEE